MLKVASRQIPVPTRRLEKDQARPLSFGMAANLTRKRRDVTLYLCVTIPRHRNIFEAARRLSVPRTTSRRDLEHRKRHNGAEEKCMVSWLDESCRKPLCE